MSQVLCVYIPYIVKSIYIGVTQEHSDTKCDAATDILLQYLSMSTFKYNTYTTH